MSLHIGRLSPDVHQVYLEHLFQRFGNCTVKLKDGYGFVVFDSNGDAARAMQALQGKYVCGERITVNWSKQQPRFSKDFKSSRIVESSPNRATRDSNFRFRDSIPRKNHPASHDQGHSPNVAPEKKSFDGALENKSSDGAPEKKSSDGAPKKKSSDGTLEKKSNDDIEVLKDAREIVGEDPVGMKRNEDDISGANLIEHDRWEETGKGNPDFHRYEPYHGYVRQEESEEVVRGSSHPGERYMNHYELKYPPACYNRVTAGHTARDYPQKTDSRLEAWRDALIRQEKKMVRLRRSRSSSRGQPDTPDCPQKTDGRFEAWRDALIREENKMVRLRSSRSPSRKQPDTPDCPDRTDGRFEASRDALSRQEKEIVMPRRFGSHSRKQSELHVDMVVETRCMIQDGRKHFSDRTSHAHRLSNVSRVDKSRTDRSEGIPQTPNASRKRSRCKRSRGSSLSPDRTTSYSTSRCSCSPYSHSREHSPSHSAHSSSKSFQPTQPEGLKSMAVSNASYPGPLLVSSKNANLDGYTETNLNKNLVCDDNVAKGVQVQKTNSEYASSVKSNKDTLAKNEKSNSLKLTANEVVSALKHCGMEARGTDLLNQPVEKYFGAARMWPWEVIYYRRFKKGPISTENYAKRLEQNKEYGIVDQYVRSSSGWWEYH
ncbi:serine/arginine-rich splicing factor 4-like [Oryza brachyantha]|uniref:RRM domain-containing protein n=1 Tax=Oryza brachyantha TaxID=4533 RepID=J3LDJ7_ORYBR|nr:serine/arginine-rich splicing factor 4-like [Oryza brachyantha]